MAIKKHIRIHKNGSSKHFKITKWKQSGASSPLRRIRGAPAWGSGAFPAVCWDSASSGQDILPAPGPSFHGACQLWLHLHHSSGLCWAGGERRPRMEWHSEPWLGSWVGCSGGQCEDIGAHIKKIRSKDFKAVYTMLCWNRLFC